MDSCLRRNDKNRESRIEYRVTLRLALRACPEPVEWDRRVRIKDNLPEKRGFWLHYGGFRVKLVCVGAILCGCPGRPHGAAPTKNQIPGSTMAVTAKHFYEIRTAWAGYLSNLRKNTYEIMTFLCKTNPIFKTTKST